MHGIRRTYDTLTRIRKAPLPTSHLPTLLQNKQKDKQSERDMRSTLLKHPHEGTEGHSAILERTPTIAATAIAVTTTSSAHGDATALPWFARRTASRFAHMQTWFSTTNKKKGKGTPTRKRTGSYLIMRIGASVAVESGSAHAPESAEKKHETGRGARE